MRKGQRVILRGAAMGSAGLAGCIVLGTLCHELVGHGGVGLLCGGTIEYVDVLGVRFGGGIEWVGLDGIFGRCGLTGIESADCRQLMLLAGSGSTWLVSVVSLIALWRVRSRHWMGVLLFLSLWWIDLLSYTLPSFGVRRFIFFGRSYREPYDAAVALGIPGPVFQGSVLLACGVQALILLWLIRRGAVAARPLPSRPFGQR